MFIEDEADAVFNEIRNQRKDSDDKEEEITTNDPVTPAVRETKAASPAPAATPMISIKVDVLNRAVEQEKQTKVEECHVSIILECVFALRKFEQ